MTQPNFFRDVAANGGLPESMIEFLHDTYGTRRALYEDIDKGGPTYIETWAKAGFTDKQCTTTRRSAIQLREELLRQGRWEKQSACVIS
jgi:hypothetical protein